MRTDTLYKVEATDSILEKVALLKTLSDDALTLELLRLSLDPYTTFGVTMSRETFVNITAFHLQKTGDIDFPIYGTPSNTRSSGFGKMRALVIPKELWWRAFIQQLNYLADRKLTGNKAQQLINEHFSKAPSLADADWAWRVLNKDLRCGVSIKLALKAFPGLVKPFDVAYAHPYRGQDIQYDGFIEPKYDGERCIFYRSKAYSRYGLEMPGAHAALKLQEVFGKWVFDGEMYKHGTPLNQTHSMCSTSAPNDLTFVVFDVIPVEDWERRCTDEFGERRAQLVRLSENFPSSVQATLSDFVNSDDVTIEHLLKWRDHYRVLGFEGAMWKRADAKYSFRRTDDVIKLKMFETIDGKIVDMYEGEGKNAGKLGGLVIELDSGVTTKLGGGFSDAQREEFWRLGSAMFGQYVEGSAQEGKTKNGKLRHGNFVRMRPDKKQE